MTEVRKKILVLGGDSFVARNYYLQHNRFHDFIFISRNKTYNDDAEIVLDDFFMVKESILDGVDTLINFAAIVHQPEIKDWNTYKKINYKLPLYFANLAKNHGVKQFIQLSTIAVYGKQSLLNINTKPSPDTYYGRSKLECDEELNKMNRADFKTLSIRPPMVYGGGKAPGNMMKLIGLIQKMKYGIPLPLNVSAKKSFINIKNLADFIDYSCSRELNGIYLLKDAEDVLMKDIAILICEELELKPRLIKPGKILLKTIKAYSEDLYWSLFEDLIIEGNFGETGFKPEHSLKDGIKEMVDSL